MGCDPRLAPEGLSDEASEGNDVFDSSVEYQMGGPKGRY